MAKRKSNNQISFRDTLTNSGKETFDEGYQEIVNYQSGNIIVEADGKEHKIYNQGAYQSIYTVDSTSVHHSKMGFPMMKAETSVADNEELTFYPFSIEVCNMMGRLKMDRGSESKFHYHSGRTARLILTGKIKMEWIQNNRLHDIELEADDWIVIPAGTPYKTIVLEKVDLISNWIAIAENMTEPKFNTIGKYRPMK